MKTLSPAATFHRRPGIIDDAVLGPFMSSVAVEPIKRIESIACHAVTFSVKTALE